MNDPPAICDHLYIHGPLSRASWPVTNDMTKNLHIMTKTPHFTLCQRPDHILTNYTRRQWCLLTQSKDTIKLSTITVWLSNSQLDENCDILNDLLWPCQCFRTGRRLMNRNDQNVTINSCNGSYSHAHAPKILKFLTILHFASYGTVITLWAAFNSAHCSDRLIIILKSTLSVSLTMLAIA